MCVVTSWLGHISTLGGNWFQSVTYERRFKIKLLRYVPYLHWSFLAWHIALGVVSHAFCSTTVHLSCLSGHNVLFSLAFGLFRLIYNYRDFSSGVCCIKQNHVYQKWHFHSIREKNYFSVRICLKMGMSQGQFRILSADRLVSPKKINIFSMGITSTLYLIYNQTSPSTGVSCKWLQHHFGCTRMRCHWSHLVIATPQHTLVALGCDATGHSL